MNFYKETKTFPNEKIQCQCGTVFEWEPPTMLETKDELNQWRPERCDPCQKIAAAEEEANRLAREEAKRLEDVKAKITAMIPPRFLATDIDHESFNRKAWDKIRNWRPTAEKPWLGLIGDTGESKTRFSYLIAETIAMEIAARYRGASFIFTTSQGIKDSIMQQFSKDTGPRDIWDRSSQDKARWRLESMRTCDLLMIDDLGKARATPAVAEELFSIINHRHDHNRPMIWTANSTPEELASHMPPDMGAPFAGRLVELSKLYSFKSPS